MRRPPSLLFVTPILPAEGGNGLAMRAGVFLDALAQDFAVTLLVVPVAGGTGALTDFVRRRTQRAVTLSLDAKLDPLWDLCVRLRDPEARAQAIAAYPRPALCRYATTPSLDTLRAALAGSEFDVVHVQRSYLVPYVAGFLPSGAGAAPFAGLDIDDDEALTHRRFAALYERLGRATEARVEWAEAAKYEQLEAQWLPRFQLRIVCSVEHARRVAAAPPARAAIVPNTVALPRLIPQLFGRQRPAPRRHMLFVGNLSYLPNVEGIRNFVMETLPLLRSRLGFDVKLRIAGSVPVPEVLALAKYPDVELVANPPTLARHYRWADLCVLPLAAGGGTRIKLLEAFAHGVPAVATAVAAEGIAAENRIHLLLAEAPIAFAEACTELLSNVELAARLARSARTLVETQYAHAVGVRAIRESYGNVYAV